MRHRTNTFAGSRPSLLRLVFKDSVRNLRLFRTPSTPPSPKTFCADDSRQASSHVVFQRSPLRRRQLYASCPDSPFQEWIAFGATLPNVSRLPSLLFLPTPTVFSAYCLVGLLHPTASRGVRAVSNTVSFRPHFCDRRSPVPSPHSHLTPSEAFPCTAAVLCHHIHFLPAVTPTYRFRFASARPQGFAPLCSPLSRLAISDGRGPDAPLGFVPLQGSPLILECSLEVLRSSSAEADSLWTHLLAHRRPGLALTEVNAERERSRSSPRLCGGCRLPRHGWYQNTAPCRPADHMPACH